MSQTSKLPEPQSHCMGLKFHWLLMIMTVHTAAYSQSTSASILYLLALATILKPSALAAPPNSFYLIDVEMSQAYH
jgi:hypothetical protein